MGTTACGYDGLWVRRLVSTTACGYNGLWVRRLVGTTVVGTTACEYDGLWVRRLVGSTACGYDGLWVRRLVSTTACEYDGLWVRRLVGTIANVLTLILYSGIVHNISVTIITRMKMLNNTNKNAKNKLVIVIHYNCDSVRCAAATFST